jgi:hypothetical protein
MVVIEDSDRDKSIQERFSQKCFFPGAAGPAAL